MQLLSRSNIVGEYRKANRMRVVSDSHRSIFWCYRFHSLQWFSAIWLVVSCTSVQQKAVEKSYIHTWIVS